MAFSCKCLPIKNAFKHVSQWFKPGSDGHGKNGHRGIDFAWPKGTAVYAVQDGKIESASKGAWDWSYGNMVAIDHGNKQYTVYAHMSKICCAKGQVVKAGQKIGEVGSTGRSTGNHLHFEISLGGRWKGVNPKPYLEHLGSSYAYDDTTSSEYSEEDYMAGGVDFTKTIETLVSSGNWRWLNDLENSEEKVPDDYQPAFSETIKKLQNSVEVFKSSSRSATEVLKVVKDLIEDEVETGSRYQKVSETIQRGTKTGLDLTQFPSLVEGPLVNIDFNGVTIGTIGDAGDKYPNYISSISIEKINGKINQYTINLTYTIRQGDDPNFIDELLSRVGYTTPIKILYGDASNPNWLFKEEEALIMSVRLNEGKSGNVINYTLQAISASNEISYKQTTYPSRPHTKASTAIFELLNDKELLKIFPGMKDRTKVASKGLIPTDDLELNIGGLQNADVTSYLSYLVSCMRSIDGKTVYILNFCTDNMMGGNYFKIVPVKSQTDLTNVSSDFFEVDIGYPSSMVMDFNINQNVYWPAVYEFNSELPGQWSYELDRYGGVTKTQDLRLTRSAKHGVTTALEENWWNLLTEYPITASLTLKGLIRPTMLGSYVKVNTIFYGEKDLASGLYVVTKQVDNLTSGGYRTTLTLLRVGAEGTYYG